MKYNKKFYDEVSQSSLNSAKAIAPYIIKKFNPNSLVDFGCGDGSWLKPFLDRNIDITGIEGDWIKNTNTKIPLENYILSNFEKKNIKIEGKFDFVLCLEVLEHLNEEIGLYLIKKMTSISDLILFSAAIPGQGGTNHINERWQSHWINLFKSYSYFPDLNIRYHFWNDSRVASYYRQNIILFRKNKSENNISNIYDVVHPEFYLLKNYDNIGIKRFVSSFFGLLNKSLNKSLKLKKEIKYDKS